jgi:hypothetical protein
MAAPMYSKKIKLLHLPMDGEPTVVVSPRAVPMVAVSHRDGAMAVASQSMVAPLDRPREILALLFLALLVVLDLA